MAGVVPATAGYGELLGGSLLVLGAVCVAAFVVVRIAGRWLATGRPRGARVVEVVARVPLEPRRALYVVEVAGKALLVGASEVGLALLSELDPAAVRAPVEPSPSFLELVRAAAGGGRWGRAPGPGGGHGDGVDRAAPGGGDGAAPGGAAGRDAPDLASSAAPGAVGGAAGARDA